MFISSMEPSEEWVPGDQELNYHREHLYGFATSASIPPERIKEKIII